MGVLVDLINNVYFVSFLIILGVVFILVVVYGITGFLRINMNTYSKCPNCSERLGTGVIACKYCGVNLNSLSAPSSNHIFKRMNDYLNNTESNSPIILARVVLLLIISVIILVLYI